MKSKEDLKKLLKKVKNNEKLVQKYIDTFQEVFELERKRDINTNLLESIFHEFTSIAYKQTDTNIFLVNQLADVEKELKSTFTEEQKRLFEVYDFIQTENSTFYGERAFIYAYCIASEVKAEIENYKKLQELKNYQN